MPSKTSHRSSAESNRHRIDVPHIDPGSLWTALANTPNVGVSITDVDGRLLFVNDTAKLLFSDTTDLDYEGKCISDFHPQEFVAERLRMIQRVLTEGKPLLIRHIYLGRNIESTVWPIRDSTPPYNRVIVVTHERGTHSVQEDVSPQFETVSTEFIDLGPLNILTRRELEVLVLLGHGMSVPHVARVLHRSPKTIQRHKAAISEKLQVRGQAEMVAIVTALGLEPSDTKLRRFS
jgi:DNA-binding CsgD family transcriptional regulator